MDVEQNEIITNVASDLIKSGISLGWEKIKGYFKDLEAELDLEYRTAFTEYLENTRARYSRLKTIIYRPVVKSIATSS